MIDKKIAKIDFAEDIMKIKSKVYGLNPILGAYVMYNGKKIKFWKVEVLDNECAKEKFGEDKLENTDNGTILLANDKEGLFVKARGGVLKIVEVQGENSKRMNVCDFLRGNKIVEGDRLV